MTKLTKKCPSCGHIFNDGEEYCPNCDLFVPISEQNEDSKKTIKTNDVTHKETNIADNKDSKPVTPTFKHRQTHLKEELEQESEEIKEEVTVEPDTSRIEEQVTEEIKKVTVEETVVQPKETIKEERVKPKEEPPAPPTPPTNNKEKEPKKPVIKVLSAIIIALLIIGGFGWYQSSQKNKEAKKTDETIRLAESELADLYIDKDHIFLKKDVSQKSLDDIKETINSLKDTATYDSFEKEWDAAKTTFDYQVAINQQFKTPILVEDSLEEDAYVKDSTTLTLKKIDNERNAFDILYNKALNVAITQKKNLKELQDAMAKIYRDKQPVKEPSADNYDAAVKLLKAIKDPEVVKEIDAQLKEVKKVLDTREKEQQEQKEKEQQQNAQNDTQIQQNNTQSNTPTPPSNNQTGRWGNREDAVIDYSDPAWAWAPGVQDKFITEVINRGYVTEGGYSLVPKYIENGEGFYDLYATTNSKLFSKSKPQEFPIYVVTVNVKTGWFKGNGPN